MGQGLSTEIGEDSLYYTNKAQLEETEQKVRESDNCHELELANRYIGEEGMTVARDLLRNNTTVRHLNLSYNRLNDDSIGVLCEGLSENNTLEILNLSGNAMTEEGAKFLAALLRTNTTLHTLILYNCSLDDRCGLALANALQHNSTLDTLNVAMNEMSELSAGFFLKCLEHNRALAVLNTKQNKITDEQQAKIHDALLQHKETQLALAGERRKRAAKVRENKEREEEEKRNQEQQRAATIESIEKQKQDMDERQKELEDEEEQLKRQHDASQFARKTAKESNMQMKKEYIQATVENAYSWRAKIGLGQRDTWHAGFTANPSIKSKNPSADSYGTVRTLQPCWCEPTDAAGYAGQLHYHCKYEQEPDAFHHDDAGLDSRKYEGCKRTGHPCVSVGVYAKPLQKDTAATFFSSRSPHHVTEHA
eukprot:TRINITY_DN3266_c0_g2_i1.p1 TRINITY_DN3266_c0_g2~~TRINITY_DN3266_c0_g2_i1.p1  ORF type:complete len:422 (+),score=98.73 TRINITY_DN3266_c0_g2_i1:61-1326(+)